MTDGPAPPPRRLFVALPVADTFASQAAHLPRRGLDARWLDPADLHITVRFLGDVPAALETQLRDALATVRRPPFTVAIEGLADFDRTTLYARVASVRKITTLCAAVTDALTPLGFDFGSRDFTPHVTLARLNRPAGLGDYIERHGPALRAEWLATSFALLQSGGGGGGGGKRYRVLQTYPLMDGA